MSSAEAVRAERKKQAEMEAALPSLKYNIWVFTGDNAPKGEAKLSLTIVGTMGTRGPFVLGDKASSLSSGGMLKFMMDIPDMGDLKKVRISHDVAGSDWHLGQILIKRNETNSLWAFPCGLQIAGGSSTELPCGESWDEDADSKPIPSKEFTDTPDGLIKGPAFDPSAVTVTPPAPYSMEIDYVKISTATTSSVAAHAEDEAWELMDNAFIQYKRLMDVQMDISNLLDEATARAKAEVDEQSRMAKCEQIKVGKAPFALAKQIEYTVRVMTGSVEGAGTDASSITVEIVGADGTTGTKEICTTGTTAGGELSAKVTGFDVGAMEKVVVAHSNSTGKGWYVEKVVVTAKKASSLFPCYRWLDAGKEDGMCEAHLGLDATAKPGDMETRDTTSAKSWEKDCKPTLAQYSVKVVTKSGGSTDCLYVTAAADTGSSGKRPLKGKIGGSGASEFSFHCPLLKNLTLLTVSSPSAVTIESVIVVDVKLNNMWIFDGTALGENTEVDLFTKNEYLYFGTMADMEAYAKERSAASAKIQAINKGKQTRTGMAKEQGSKTRDEKLESDIKKLSNNPAELKKMLLQVNGEMAKAEEEQAKLKETNSQLAGKLAELEKQRANEKEKLQSELDDAKKKLEAALEASKVPPPAAEPPKKSGVCTIL